MKLSLSFFLLLFSMFITLTACGGDVAVNQSIVVEDGEVRTGSLSSVNGNITVGENCEIRGDCQSVNGRIRIGNNSSVQDLNSVNGSIDIGESVKVEGDASTVNGGIYFSPGCEITGTVTTINGKVELTNSRVRRNIETVNGDVELLKKSVVEGSIIVEETHGNSGKDRKITIRLADESVVEGDILVKDERVEVKVYLSGGSKVVGNIKNAMVFNE